MWSSQLSLRFKQSQSRPEKCFRGFNGIQAHGLELCVSAAMLHKLSYEDPYAGSRPIHWIHRTRERNEPYEYYVNCGHTNEMKMSSSQLSLRFKQSQSKPVKCFHIIFICFIPFTGTMNSINWPAPNVWVFIAQLVEHCTANAEAMDSKPVEAQKTFFGLTLRLLKSQRQLG